MLKQNSDPTNGQSGTYLNNIAICREARILSDRLLFVTGIQKTICNKQILKSKQFFGYFGDIEYLQCNLDKRHKNLCQVYVKYKRISDVIVAALCLQDLVFMGYQLKVQMGFTKYCKNYLRKRKCKNNKCIYMHFENKKQLKIDQYDQNARNYYSKLENQQTFQNLIHTTQYIKHIRNCFVHKVDNNFFQTIENLKKNILNNISKLCQIYQQPGLSEMNKNNFCSCEYSNNFNNWKICDNCIFQQLQRQCSNQYQKDFNFKKQQNPQQVGLWKKHFTLQFIFNKQIQHICLTNFKKFQFILFFQVQYS